MRNVPIAAAVLGIFAAFCASGADKYTGPRPPKPDLPYLVHASTLIPTEVVQASEQDKKDDTVYTVTGAASPARTPLAEPVFLMESDKLNPEKMDLWQMQVKNGQREIALPKKAKRNSPRPMRVLVTRLEGRLYKIEVAQVLENGEYSLSPNDSNTAFCFGVF